MRHPTGFAAALLSAVIMFAPAGRAGDGDSFEDDVSAAKAAMMSDPDQALTLARHAWETANALPEPEARALAEATAKWLEAEALVRVDKAKTALKAAAEGLDVLPASALGTKIEGDLLLARGRAAQVVSETQLALESLIAAHRAYTQAGVARSQTIALQSLASLYVDARQYDRALDYYDQAAAAMPDDPSLALAGLNNRGNALKDVGRYAEAVTSFDAALEVAREFESPALNARIRTNLAAAQIAQGDAAAAAETLRQGFVDAEAAGEAGAEWRRYLWGVEAELAYVQADLPRARAALEHAFEGLDLTTTNSRFRDTHEAAALIYEGLGETRSALAHARAFKRIDDEGLALAASANAALMSAEFDLSAKELEIERLRTEQLEADVRLAQSTARQRTIVLGSIAALLLLAAGAALAGYTQMRSSRNRIRAVNTELESVNTALDRANKAKSEFLATTSHEIRTPLNGILGMTESLLRDADLPASARERLASVRGAGEIMSSVINDILDVAKIDQGALELDPIEANPAAVVSDTVTLWRESATAKGLALTLDVSECPTRAILDPTRLRQVLFNLISNAVKFTDAGSVAITAKLSTIGTQEHLMISVRDTGVGIPVHEQQKVFEAFHQVEGGTRRRHGGTGLGLAICRNIALAMNGTVSLESTLGEGSTFTLIAPLVRPLRSETVAFEGRLLIACANPLEGAVLKALAKRCAEHVEDAGPGVQGEALVVALGRGATPTSAAATLAALQTSAPLRLALIKPDGAPDLEAARDAYRAAGFTDVLTAPPTLETLTAALTEGAAPTAESDASPLAKAKA